MERTALKNIIPDESRLVFDHIPPEFLSDTLGRRKGEASALVFAKSTEEVSKLLQYAHANRIPVTPRGAGTNLVGSTVPVDGGIILDLSQMNRILELDTETMTVTVEPGLLLQDLQAYVEEHGLFYPPDPGEKASSIGGNISTNAGGMRAVKYGVTRDYVRGLEVVTADGTVLTVGGKNVKDASGLSLKHLYIGSEGTLAVITKCVLKVIPKPEASLSILVPYPDLKTGIGISHTNPQGAYYVLLDISEFGYASDLEFCDVLAREVGVGAVPGSSFFREPVNHLIRLHFAKKDETLNAALNRLEDIRKKIPAR